MAPRVFTVLVGSGFYNIDGSENLVIPAISVLSGPVVLRNISWSTSGASPDMTVTIRHQVDLTGAAPSLVLYTITDDDPAIGRGAFGQWQGRERMETLDSLVFQGVPGDDGMVYLMNITVTGYLFDT